MRDFAPCPSVVAMVILAAFVAAETPVISVARPLALMTPDEVLTLVYATMMLREGVAGTSTQALLLPMQAALAAPAVNPTKIRVSE